MQALYESKPYIWLYLNAKMMGKVLLATFSFPMTNIDIRFESLLNLENLALKPARNNLYLTLIFDLIYLKLHNRIWFSHSLIYSVAHVAFVCSCREIRSYEVIKYISNTSTFRVDMILTVFSLPSAIMQWNATMPSREVFLSSRSLVDRM